MFLSLITITRLKECRGIRFLLFFFLLLSGPADIVKIANYSRKKLSLVYLFFFGLISIAIL
ncbi:hypothetical protein C1645_777359 [Glomus cerebriforme]|uniref:Uncharacterized protein n=1 Tax=Glomus cerebriforme TaxID=658196 RepID=A0A397SEM2_9GLOM|nr:hypothetical protein C1645_787860 [Glomus cerebriforme]RIA87398.1 hypothetical protein C1645_777359 [Glomus cerebriforme]